MTADFSVKITVRNGRLLAAIRTKYGTSANMARKTGIKPHTIAGLLTMKISPLYRGTEWTKAAYDISSALHMEPEDIWPAHVARIKLNRNEAEIDMTVLDVQDMLTTDPSSRAMKAIAEWARHVKPRYMKALVMQANGATLDDIGKALNVGRERARQITMKASRTIRRRAKIDGVKSLADMRL